MIRSPIRPLAVLFGYRDGHNKLAFIGRAGRIIVEGHSRELLQILRLCDGLTPLQEIRRKCAGISHRVFSSLLRVSLKHGLVCDSRALYRLFHLDSSNPMQFESGLSPADVVRLQAAAHRPTGSTARIELPSLATPFLALSAQRHTTRSFKDRRIPARELAGLLESMYGARSGRSTPSAGALYPLRLYVFVRSQKQSIPKGTYEYLPARHQLVPVGPSFSDERLSRMLDSADAASNSAFVIFVAAEMDRSPRKYANRGYRYTLIEVGHAAQGAALYCAEQGLGVLEYGGFQDQIAASVLGLNFPKEAVLLTLIVGAPAQGSRLHEQDPRQLSDQAWALSQRLVGEGRPIRRITVHELRRGNYVMPRLVGVALYRAPTPFVPKRAERRLAAFATGVATDETIVKTISEGYERYRSGCLRTDMTARAVELGAPWLDPRVISPYTGQQLRFLSSRRFQPFDPRIPWQWVEGQRYPSGETTYVTVDNVFYPLHKRQLGRRLCHEANSSGVAAHSDFRQAILNGLLELIERDAIAVMWYAKRRVRAVSDVMVGNGIRDRASYWRSNGRQVKFLDLTLDSVPVVVATIYSRNLYPHFVSGAAAGFNYETAIEKAFNEAEFMLLSWIAVRRRAIRSEKVRTPDHHGILYFSKRSLAWLRWLLMAKQADPGRVTLRESDLLAAFDPVVVDLNRDDKRSGLHVVRVISGRLLPLNFGYGKEHYGHARLKVLGWRWTRRWPSLPHFFA